MLTWLHASIVQTHQTHLLCAGGSAHRQIAGPPMSPALLSWTPKVLPAYGNIWERHPLFLPLVLLDSPALGGAGNVPSILHLPLLTVRF